MLLRIRWRFNPGSVDLVLIQADLAFLVLKQPLHASREKRHEQHRLERRSSGVDEELPFLGFKTSRATIRCSGRLAGQRR